MMRRAIAFFLTCLIVASAAAAVADGSGIVWTDEERARLRVGNPTAFQGHFFTTMWGGATSDLDVQNLLHAYSLVCYDIELSRFRFDHSVVQDAIAMDDEDGNRTYLLMLYDDLYWSNGTPITAADYAFSILFCMDPVIGETGGNPMDYSWIVGSDEYLAHTSPALSGLRIVTDQMLQIQVKATAIPYFYELSRLMINPYPISVIAPEISVRDDGAGAYLSEPLTAEMINRTVLEEHQGYLSHPSVVSGPYVLTDYQWPTAKLEINPYFKGTEDGTKPRIGEVEYTLAEIDQMVESLVSREYGLFNKITLSEKIQSGLRNIEIEDYAYSFESYARSGLTLLWFTESSPKVQELEVRKAIVYCFDRDGFVRDYVAPYGLRMDGFYGLGQWMFRLASGQMGAPVDENLPEEERQAAVDAFETITLDDLTVYDVNLREADRLLETAGWRRNEQGIRCKTVDGETVELRLILGLPESAETRTALENNFVTNLESVGVAVTLQPMGMDDIEKAYKGETDSVDLLYFGEDFMIAFDPEILAPTTGPADLSPRGSLPAVKAELYGMAVDMVRTDPADLPGFMQKWVALQERITETLPLLPVYSNVYFDFFSRELHDYRITKAVTSGEAIVKSYVSDAELLREDEIENLQNEMTEMDDSFETQVPEE